MNTKRTIQLLNVLMIGLMATACVHAQVERTGRARLGGGSEGQAQMFQNAPAGYEEVAVIAVDALALGDAARLERHILRQASLLGCDGVVKVASGAESAKALCLKRRSDAALSADAIDLKDAVVLAAPETLRQRAAKGGAYGLALLKALDRAQDEQDAQKRAWPLRWYVQTYPQSPFVADVQALFVSPDAASEMVASAAAPVTVRTAPQAQ